MKFRLKVGDRVRIKKDLVIGEVYNMKYSDVADTFSERMNQYRGKEATVMNITFDGKYKLDIDPIHQYTDEMLTPIHDVRAKEEYKENVEVENLINHMVNLAPMQIEKMKAEEKEKAINHALDTRNEELFMKLTEEYKKENN